MALFLVSVISTMLIHAYVLSKQQVAFVHRKLEQQFDVQWIMDLLAGSLRHAGFTPCLGIEQLHIIDRRAVPHFITQDAIAIQHNELRINRMSEFFSTLRSVQQPQQLFVSPQTRIKKGHAVLIADCDHGELHEVAGIQKKPQGTLLTLDSPLFFNYSTVTYVGQWLEERWFIKYNNKGLPALYYQQKHREELSPLIHSLVATKHMPQGKQLLTISLELNNNTTRLITVAVRS